MGWAVTADVERFDEAVDWFLARTVITGDVARSLDDRLKVEAFWVGGGLQLSQIQRVFDKIAEAATTGESFEEWRKRVRNELTNDAHAETVFRNAIQRQYNAGRWAQMTDPSVQRFRPFGLVDAILDGATTAYCREVNGTILPLDDPWWDTHFFPAHHRCRTSIRNLRRSEAERRGITDLPPDISPAPGFGQGPRLQAPPWKPDPQKHDPVLVAELEKKAPVAPITRPKAEKKRYRADVWERGYRAKYGEAAPAVAAGRAALERGLDLSVQEVRDALAPVDQAPGVRDLLASLEDLDPATTLRSSAGELDPIRKGAAALAGHRAAITPRATALSHPQLDTSPIGREAQAFYSGLSDRSVSFPSDWGYEPDPNRSWCNPSEKRIGYYNGHDRKRRGELAHEIGHALEALNPKLGRRAVEFLRRRTHGPIQKLKDATGVGYGDDEVFRQDEFIDAYIGKWYEHGGHLWATELTAMAVELLFNGQTHWGSLRALIRRDPELFYFLLGQLSGR